MMQATLQAQWLESGQIWSDRLSRWLRRALWLSLGVHVVLMFWFLLARTPAPVEPETLEVILVNSQTETAPEKADALAQVALDGGGDQKTGRAKSPLPASSTPSVGTPPPPASEKRVRELESMQKAMREKLAANDGDTPRTARKQDKPAERQNISENANVKQPVPVEDLRLNARELARLEAQVARQIEDYNKRPRLHFFSPSTSPYVFAMYEEAWRQKVERFGNLNYPDEARGKVYGQLRMTVYIRQDGTLQDFVLDRSSGSPILDRAARRIVEQAGPYGAFTPEMAKAADVLVITRTWMFTNDSLETRSR